MGKNITYKCFCGSLPKHIFNSVACMNEKCPLHAKSFSEKEWSFIHEAIPLQHLIDQLRELFKNTCTEITISLSLEDGGADSILVQPFDDGEAYRYFGDTEEDKTIDNSVDYLVETLTGE